MYGHAEVTRILASAIHLQSSFQMHNVFFTALILKHDGVREHMEKEDAGVPFIKQKNYLKLRWWIRLLISDSIQLWL